MRRKLARSVCGAVACAMAVVLDGGRSLAAQSNRLADLAGDWRLTVFLVGPGQFGGPRCAQPGGPGPPAVTIAAPNGGAVSLAMSCDDGSEYAFRLSRDSATEAYLLTVTSTHGISVTAMPVAYDREQGWRGARDEPVGGDTLSVTAMVVRIEGRNWRGWQIAVLPTSAIGAAELDDIKHPYVRADLTRRK